MAVLGSLKVLLFGDSTQLEKTLKSTRKGMDTFKKYAMQAAGAIGVAFSFTAAIQGLSKFYDKLDDIGKKSSALGVTAEYYQKMQYAAERTGSSLDQVYASMNRLVKFAGDAKIGNAEAQKTFEALGLAMSEIDGLRADELFELVNRQLAEMPDNLARNAYGAKLMGEEYGRLSNYLRDYIALGKEAEDKGLIISSEQVKEVEAFKDAFTDLWKSIEVAGASLMKMARLTEHLHTFSEGTTAVFGGAKNAEKKAGILSEAEMIADARRRIAADPQLASKFRRAGDSSDQSVKRFAQANNMYSSYEGNIPSWQSMMALSLISPLAASLVPLAAGAGSERYLARSTDREVQLRRDVTARQYADQQEKREAERLAAEHREIEARGLEDEEITRLLNLEMEKQRQSEAKAAADRAAAEAKARSNALIASFSAPSRAGVALDGSIAAYKSQFNNERNFQHFMRENLKKSTDLQQQIATNTAALNNGLPAIVGAEIGAK